jgi:hypothetical protein
LLLQISYLLVLYFQLLLKVSYAVVGLNPLLGIRARVSLNER